LNSPWLPLALARVPAYATTAHPNNIPTLIA
jgi:hypothetical protein